MKCHGCLVGEARPFSNLCQACIHDLIEDLREERRQQMEALERLHEENDGWMEDQAKKILEQSSGLTPEHTPSKP